MLRSILSTFLVTLMVPTMSPVTAASPPPAWASEGVIHRIAGIVAGEAPSHAEAQIVVACTVIRDIEAQGPAIIAAPNSRWRGYRRPTSWHVNIVENALRYGYCHDLVPNCRFLGNLDDLVVWQRLGYPTFHFRVYGDEVSGYAVCVLQDRMCAKGVEGECRRRLGADRAYVLCR